MSVLLIETTDYKNFLPIANTRFLWDITCGIYTPLQRFEKQFHDVKVYSCRFDDKAFGHLKGDYGDKVYAPNNPVQTINTVVNSQYIPFENLSPQINQMGITKDGKFVYLRLEDIKPAVIEKLLKNDLKALMSKIKVVTVDSGMFLKRMTDIVNNNAEAIEFETYLVRNDGNFISPNNNIYIDKTAKIQQFVSLQADHGPIIIDKGAVVRAFSIIDGPAYIGKNTVIDSAKIRGGTTIKDVCRIGGEVEATVMESYSNKHHEGFLGHSYVGSWVNIGAMATTSDLKNNYGNVRLKMGREEIDTGTPKFGSIICDYAKIGIGVMLNTGSVISEGANIYLEDKQTPKFVKPFAWGQKGRYEIVKFIRDAKKAMSRRNAAMSEDREKFLRERFRATKPK